jgi:hypothetical protein
MKKFILILGLTGICPSAFALDDYSYKKQQLAIDEVTQVTTIQIAIDKLTQDALDLQQVVDLASKNNGEFEDSDFSTSTVNGIIAASPLLYQEDAYHMNLFITTILQSLVAWENSDVLGANFTNLNVINAIKK